MTFGLPPLEAWGFDTTAESYTNTFKSRKKPRDNAKTENRLPPNHDYIPCRNDAPANVFKHGDTRKHTVNYSMCAYYY